MKGEHHILLPFTTKSPSPEWESTVFVKKTQPLLIFSVENIDSKTKGSKTIQSKI